jgi:heptaprenyl diphosphate synthase
MNDDKQEYFKIALLVSISCVLQISESLIPNPIPGLRLGLANMITLIVFYRMGFKYALEIAIFRTILSSFLMGTFLSPTFILSISGAIGSTLVMGALFWLSKNTVFRIGMIGISMIGALTHNMLQLVIAYGILIHHKGIFMFIPWLFIGSVMMGWLTGNVAANVCRKLRDREEGKSSEIDALGARDMTFSPFYNPGDSMIHRMKGEIKLLSLLLLSASILFFKSSFLMGFAAIFSVVLIHLSKIPYQEIKKRNSRYGSLLIFSFLLPVFFNSGTHSLFQIASFNITREGISMGIYFASRITLLITFSLILGMTTSSNELARSLSVILTPLQFIGISEKRIAGIFSISLIFIPVFLEIISRIINTSAIKNAKNIRNFIPELSNLIEKVYLESEKKDTPC